MVLKNIVGSFLFFVIAQANALEYLNTLRQKCGAAPLKMNQKLNYAAKKHALYLSKNHLFSHFETPKKAYFFAKTPWNRLEKAKMNTIAVNENISFYNLSYKDSINQLLSTIYHRISFLDERVDIIGYAKVNEVFVYDLSNSKLNKLCKKARKLDKVLICAKNKALNFASFYDAINKVSQKSKKLIICPYNGQKGVPLTLVKETPLFTNKIRGFAISVIFNRFYFKKVQVKQFKLFSQKKEVLSKIVTKGNDKAKKLEFNQIILLPLRPLQRAKRYEVLLRYSYKNRVFQKRWFFFTKY